MKKLRNKTFLVLFIILTLFSLSLIVILNYRTYQKELSSIQSKINKLETRHDNIFIFDDLDDNRPVFFDTKIYLVTYDKDVITNIENFSDNNVTDEEIKQIANNYINGNYSKLGNIYFNKYAYIERMNSLIILDINDSNKIVINTLNISIMLFIILEIIVTYISVKITYWLVEPVDDAFNKQKQFIYDASHELKTPLAVVMANAETIELNDSNNKWVNNIKSETERMSKLVTTLLDLSKSEDENQKNNFEEINISKTIEKSLLTFESLMFENNLKLDYILEENIKFKCDEEKIKQLVSILMDNAIKHSLSKSKITVKLNKEKDNIIFSVKNRGNEIPIEEREKIFERFYRVDKSRNRNENRYGLGLAIAKNIVTNHNGNIHVECSHGYTTFIVNMKQIN